MMKETVLSEKLDELLDDTVINPNLTRVGSKLMLRWNFSAESISFGHSMK
jgi:hypothetical protein